MPAMMVAGTQRMANDTVILAQNVRSPHSIPMQHRSMATKATADVTAAQVKTVSAIACLWSLVLSCFLRAAKLGGRTPGDDWAAWEARALRREDRWLWAWASDVTRLGGIEGRTHFPTWYAPVEGGGGGEALSKEESWENVWISPLDQISGAPPEFTFLSAGVGEWVRRVDGDVGNGLSII
jgi:hypothetical protein